MQLLSGSVFSFVKRGITMVLTSVVCCVIENIAYECILGTRHSLMHSATTITEAVMKLSSTEMENHL